MKAITTIEELMQELESHKYNYYGLRGSSAEELEKVNDGYLKECSSVWEDGTPTDEKLNGTCAVGVFDELPKSEIMSRYNTAKNRYSVDGTVLLIADSEQEYGNDENETILGHDGYGADVVAVVKL